MVSRYNVEISSDNTIKISHYYYFYLFFIFLSLPSTSLWGIYSYNIHPSITLFHSLIDIVDIFSFSPTSYRSCTIIIYNYKTHEYSNIITCFLSNQESTVVVCMHIPIFLARTRINDDVIIFTCSLNYQNPTTFFSYIVTSHFILFDTE